MAPIPDAIFYDDTASDGTGSELIASDDDDDVGHLLGEFAVPFSGTTLIHLLELAEAHQATRGSWLDDSISELELNFDSGAGSETSSDPGEIPDLVPSIVADQRFTSYSDNVVLTGSNNDVSDLFHHVWVKDILIATRNPRPFMRREAYLNEPGMLQT